MRVLITGATGLVGRALVLRLRRDGHTPIAWTRNLTRARSLLGHEAEFLEMAADDQALVAALQRCDAVVNLAGEPIIGPRWSAARKRALVDSRVGLTERLVQALQRANPRPKVLVSASAVGYYGSQGDAALAEDAAAGDDFLATLCVAWEAAARRALTLGLRVVTARIGLVLGHEGGLLAQLLPMFEAGLGGPLGDGRQCMPWIHLHDLVESLVTALTDMRLQGPYNAVAPTPVTNQAFTQALAHAVGRSAHFRVPAAILSLRLGEAATAALASQRALPQILLSAGFNFQFPSLADALNDLCGDAQAPSAVQIQPAQKSAIQPVAAAAYLEQRPPRYVLQARTVLPRPLSEVFEFFCRAENLGLLTPVNLALVIDGAPPGEMHTDLEIAYTLRVGPLPMRWKTRIMRWDPPHCFVDAQLRGPYRCWWHEHHFTAQGDHTVMEDRVFYAPPLGPLGALANKIGVAEQLRRIFAYRNSAIALRYGTAPASV